MPKHKGIDVTFGNGATLVVPPLSLRHVEQFGERLASYSGGVAASDIGLVVDVVHASLSRNYGELTRNDVADLVDLGNMQEVMQACMGVSGFKERAPGEAQPATAVTG